MTSADMVAYIRAAESSRLASNARRDLPPGSSRAKVTRANARWASLAEERDRLGALLPDDFTAAIQRHLGVDDVR